MIPESQFANSTPSKKRKSRKLRKNYTVVACRDAKAKGRYKPGEGFNKFLKADRKPTMIA